MDTISNGHSFLSMPPEIRQIIFSFIPDQELVEQVSLVCKVLFEEMTLLPIWRNKLIFCDSQIAENTDTFSYIVQTWQIAYRHFKFMQKEGRVISSTKIIKKNGDILEGQFYEGKLNGLGRITYANGIIKEGNFLNNRLNGQGSITFEEEKREGNFINEDLTGQGKRTYLKNTKTLKAGTIFEGDFVRSMLFNGTVTYPDGSADTVENGWL
jgi:hypothetical protein